VPFNAIPAKDFIDREGELSYLKHLSEGRGVFLPANILLEGDRGAGKTELLKQFYRVTFWEEKKAVPFYYSFRSAALKGSRFARDYFTRFVRQYLAYVTRDPSFIDQMGVPLAKLMPIMYSLRLNWLIELVGDFQSQAGDDDLYGRVFAAISAPVAAAGKGGVPVVVMLDDFPLASGLYEDVEGDIGGAVSLFEESLKSSLCLHVLTGSPLGALESIFTDNALRGRAERMVLKPLPEDAACSLFAAFCGKLGIREEGGSSQKLMRVLGGNPLYIRNMARALWKMKKKEAAEKDLWEAYSYEVSEGETFFYWASILGEVSVDAAARRTALTLLKHSLRDGEAFHDPRSLSGMLGLGEKDVRPVLEALYRCGLVQAGGGGLRRGVTVLQDFILSLSMMEMEGISADEVREVITGRHYAPADVPTSFEMVIPMVSDAELVAARAVEQIARNTDLDMESSGQLQMAIIEACINAMEHSGSYDKKIFLRITVFREKFEVVIESPGKYFDPEAPEGPETGKRAGSDRKRGWGLKLMRKVMDDVRVERVGERTRLILVKKRKPNEVLNESSQL